MASGRVSTTTITALNPGAGAYRWEVARIGIDANDWNQVGLVELDLYEDYWDQGSRKRYYVYYGYIQGNPATTGNAGVYLAEVAGATRHGNARYRVTLGAEVTVSGDHRYIPVYVEISFWHVVTTVIRTNRQLTTNATPPIGTMYIDTNPTGVVISDFTPDTNVYINNVSAYKSIFQYSNVGIGVSDPAYPLTINKDNESNTSPTLALITAAAGGSPQIRLQNGTTTWTPRINASTGRFEVYNVSNNATPFTIESTTPSTRMYMNSTGVGINTGAPTTALSVQGSIAALTDFNASVYNNWQWRGLFYENTQQRGVGIAYSSPGGHVIQGLSGGGNGNLSLNNYGGNVGVGGTNPIARFEVTGSGTSTGATAHFVNSSGTSLLFVRDDGRVGINTPSPQSALQLNNVISSPTNTDKVLIGVYDLFNGGNNAQYLRIFGGPTGFNYVSNWGDISFGARWDGTTERRQDLTINTSNNVGIGTTSYVAKLFVSGSSVATTPTMIVKEGVVNPTGGALVFEVENSAGTTILAVTGSGNVGVGTSTPVSRLTVATTTQATNGNYTRANAHLTLYGTSGSGLGGPFIKFANNFGGTDEQGWWIQGENQGGTKSLKFGEGSSAEYVRITTAGNVGIGTNNPQVALQVRSAGSANTYRGVIRIDNTSSDKWAGLSLPDSVDAADSNSNNYYFIGRGQAIANRVMSFHVPNATDYGSGVQPTIVFYSTGADRLFEVEASTGRGYFKGRLGVGLTDPSAQLANTNTADGIAAANSSGIQWKSTANDWAAVIIGRPASGNSYGLRVHSGGTTASDIPFAASSGAGTGTVRLLVTGAGNVGIGTATPLMGLHVAASIGNPVYGGLDGNGNEFLIRGNLYYDLTNSRAQPITTGFQSMIAMANNVGGIRFYTSPGSVAAGSVSTVAERMVIDPSGYVGIGLANPTNRLVVKTQTAAGFQGLEVEDYLDTTGMYFQSVSGGSWRVLGGNSYYYDSGNFRSDSTVGAIINLHGGEVKFYTNSGLTANTNYVPTARMTINSSGNVGIGTTDTNGNRLAISGGNLSVSGSVLPFPDNSVDLGTTSYRWRNLYLSNTLSAATVTASGLTQGSVVFAGSGGTLSQDNTKLFWDNSNKRLGIGNSAPAHPLDVTGTSRYTGIAYYDGGESIQLFGIRGRFTGEAMHLYNKVAIGYPSGWGGDVGTTPIYGLSTFGGAILAYNQGTVSIGTTATTARLIVSGSSTTTVPTMIVREGVVSPTNGALAFEVEKSSGATLFAVSGSGNVGIGTSIPNATFEVVGVSGSLFSVTDNLSGSLFSVNTISGLPILEVFSDNTLIAGAYNSNALVVTGSNVGVGVRAPSVRFQVSGSSISAVPTSLFKAGVGSPTGAILDVQQSDGTSLLYVSGSSSTNYVTAYGVSQTSPSNTAGIFRVLSSATNALIMGALTNAPFATYIQSGGGNQYPLSLNPLGGNVGVGVTNPSYLLDVNGQIRASALVDLQNTSYLVDPASTSVLNLVNATGFYDADGGNARRFVNPGGGSLTTSTAIVTGALKIRFPSSRNNSSTMSILTIKIYEYVSGRTQEYRVGGYNYSLGNWYNIFAYNLTDSGPNYSVRFGYDGTSDCIWIGETNTGWSYPQVFLTEVLTGYSGYSADWSNGWSLSWATSFDTVEQGPFTPNRFWGNNNDGTGSGLDADLLDGYDSAAFARGNGTQNYVVKWTGTATVGNSQIFDNGTSVGVGTNAPSNTLDVNGTARVRTISNATGNFATYSATGVLQQRTAAEVKTDIGLSNVQNLSVSQIFNNTGAVHGTRNDFANITDFGYQYVQGATNGPGLNSATQYYAWSIGLGSEYPYSGANSYAAQFAIGRNVVNPYLGVRFREDNAWASWQKLAAGNADTLTTARTLWGQSFDGSGNVTGNLTSVGNITGNSGITLTAAGTLSLVASGANVITATTNGTEALRIDSSQNVGIGTATAGTRLHVYSGATDEVTRFESTGNPYISLYDTGVRQGYLYSNTSSVELVAENSKPLYLQGATEIRLRTNTTTDRVIINSGGMVGIGYTPPITTSFSKLMVASDITLAKTNASLLGNLYYDTAVPGFKYAANGYGWGFREDNAGKLQMVRAGNNTSGANAAASISLTDLFTFDLVDNRVGLGTGSPSTKFHVLHTSNDPVMIEQTTDTAWNRIYFKKPTRSWTLGPDNSTGTNNLFVLADETAGSYRVTVDTSGNVGINTSSMSRKLVVHGSDALINGLTVGRGGVASNVGASNTALGSSAGAALTVGYSNNTSIGGSALTTMTVGERNTAVGNSALLNYNPSANTGDSTAIGYSSLYNSTSGVQNTAIGSYSLYSATTNSQIVAIGFEAMRNGSSMDRSVAVGYRSMYVAGGDNDNTAVGYQSAYSLDKGNRCTSVGSLSLWNTKDNGDSTAIGYASLYANTGSYNTAVGSYSLVSNTTAAGNTAVGYASLLSISTNTGCTAAGFESMYSTTGADNTAMGYQAGRGITSGFSNVAIGLQTLYSATGAANNVAIGNYALNLTISNSNVAIGHQAGRYLATTTDGNNTLIGAAAGTGASGFSTFSYNTVVGSTAGTSLQTSTYNVLLGFGAGSTITTSGKNVLLGRYDGNSGGLDIRASSAINNNNIVLSDGDGNIRARFDYRGAVGIGTTTAFDGYKMHICSGSVDSTLVIAHTPANDKIAGFHAFAFSRLGVFEMGTTTLKVGSTTSNPLSLVTNNTRAIYVDTSQRVGIGTDTMVQKLHIGAAAQTMTATPDSISLGGTYSDQAGVTSKLKLRLYDDGAGVVNGFGISNLQMDYSAMVNVSHVWYINNSEVMRINPSGYVGIGTSTITGQFHVYKSTDPTEVTIQNNTMSGRATLKFLTNGNDWEIGARGSAASPANAFYIYDNAAGAGAGAYRQVINSNGNMGIGTTNPTATLSVMCGATQARINAVYTDYAGIFLNGSTTDNDYNFLSNASGSDKNLYINRPDGWDIRFRKNNGDQVTITSGGNVGIGLTGPTYLLQLNVDSAGKPFGGSWANSSDSRLKENVIQLTGSLEKLLRLRGVEFDWKVNDKGQDHAVGFIAQEVEQIFPEWVREVGPSEEESKYVTDKVKAFGVGNDFFAYSIEAMRELKSENDSLKSEIQSLKDQISSILAMLNNK